MMRWAMILTWLPSEIFSQRPGAGGVSEWSCQSCHLRSPPIVDAKSSAATCCDKLIHHRHQRGTPCLSGLLQPFCPPSLSLFNSLCGSLWQKMSLFFSACCVQWSQSNGRWKRPVEVSLQPARPSFCEEVRVVKIVPIHLLVLFSAGCWLQWSHRVVRQREGPCGRTLVPLFCSIPGMSVVRFWHITSLWR